MDAQIDQFSANYNTPLPVDPSSGNDDHDSVESEGEDDGGVDDGVGNLFDLAEAAHLVDAYHADEDIIPLLEDFTFSTPNNSPQKRNHL
jgi:hypothetical protein